MVGHFSRFFLGRGADYRTILEELNRCRLTYGHDPLIFWLSDSCDPDFEREVQDCGGRVICTP
jgi:hypothetical protein